MKAIDPLIRTTDEIVADIIRALDAAAAIKPTVLLAIDGLRQLSKYPPLTGYRKDNERFAQRLQNGPMTATGYLQTRQRISICTCCSRRKIAGR